MASPSICQWVELAYTTSSHPTTWVDITRELDTFLRIILAWRRRQPSCDGTFSQRRSFAAIFPLSEIRDLGVETLNEIVRRFKGTRNQSGATTNIFKWHHILQASKSWQDAYTFHVASTKQQCHALFRRTLGRDT